MSSPPEETTKTVTSEGEKTVAAAAPSNEILNASSIKAILAFCLVITLASLICMIVLAFKFADDNKSSTSALAAQQPTIVVNTGDVKYATGKPPTGENPCDGKKPDLPNVACVIDAVANVGPQAGANVTKGYQGSLDVDNVPITTPYWMNGMCPVNVHWHLGAEHYSLGEYDETGTGPIVSSQLNDLDRRQLAEESRARLGFRCKLYNDTDEKFITPFVWEHCVGMRVGETYEVHWPHSAAGACGTLNQYQTPFYDGVFCRDGVISDTASQIGVQAQVFTIVNDESYYYPDLMRGMIVDGEYGSDMAMYTGSTTGTTRDNEVCSQFSPITWQVDRKCHLVSASTFDKMCADMKAQRDDMRTDLVAHGARELVADNLAADNHQRYLRA